MTRSKDNIWLSRYAWLTALATLVLIGFGGLVTSHGAGLSVPDWPNTYGYNMFLFPVSKWVGGIFYEHTHRLAGAGVGLLTVVLTVWLWLKEERRWLRWLGVAALVSVLLQGMLGGLRVTLLADRLGIVHAALAQLFLVLVAAIALFCSRWWQLSTAPPVPACALRGWLVGSSLAVLGQLLLGATMRHEHAGLAIPDFPLAYGKLWPAMDPAAIESYNRSRMEVNAVRPITAFQIGLQMTHRLVALAIAMGVGWCWASGCRYLGWPHPVSRLIGLWTGLIGIQIALGAATICSGKSADIATLHVVVGAVSLAVGALATLMAFRPASHLSNP